MIRSLIISKARKLVNDTGSNPFHTDNECHGILDTWESKIAAYMGFPKKVQTISFAIGEGGSSGKDLDSDIFSVRAVAMEPTTGDNHYMLFPITEEDLNRKTPNWRTLGNERPRFWLFLDAIAADAAEFTNRTITTDRTVDVAYTMRIFGWQLPAASTTGANSPVISPTFHSSGMYYLASEMLFPRNERKAALYRRLYEADRREAKTLSPGNGDESENPWGQYPILGDETGRISLP